MLRLAKFLEYGLCNQEFRECRKLECTGEHVVTSHLVMDALGYRENETKSVESDERKMSRARIRDFSEMMKTLDLKRKHSVAMLERAESTSGHRTGEETKTQ